MDSKSLDKILNDIDAIPENMLGRNEAKFLYELSKKTKDLGDIVEIGTCAGKSTIALAYGQKDKGGRQINTIDIRVHPDLEENLERAGISDFVKKHIGRSSAIGKIWSAPIELLFIDGDHRYNGIVCDIKYWSDMVVVGGLMIFHDYPKVGGQVVNQTALAVRRKVLSKPDTWRVLYDRQAGNIFVCERISRRYEEVNFRSVAKQILYVVKGNIRWYFEEIIDKWIGAKR
jgi:predicted O-methyltransferase YrrM